MDREFQQEGWARLAAGNPGCPSDFALDRLHAGELQDEQAASLRAHISGCALCPDRMATRQAGFAAVPQLDERVLLAGIRRRMDEAPPASLIDRVLGTLRRLSKPLSLAAGVALLAIVLVSRTSSTGDRDSGLEQTREKGALALSVFRLQDGRAQQTISGDHFVTGDRIRFVVDLPTAGNVAVLGIEPKGGLYVAWPTQPRDASRPAGKAQELPGAVALDASVGKETLYLVLCPGKSVLPATACQAVLPGEPPTCPRGCQLTPFVLNKN